MIGTDPMSALEECGYFLLRGAISRAVCQDIRDFVDRTIAGGHVKDPGRGSSRFHHRICHPIEDPIVVRLAADPVLREIATECLRARDLRLRQQMFMLTSPCGSPPPALPDGWHTDTTFLAEEWEATPRQTFLQVFCYCSVVRSGGASTWVVPGSHRQALAAASAANFRTEEERWGFGRNVIRLANIDLSQAVELTCEEGDVAIFCPMLLHSGSNNVTNQPRYVFHCSFHDAAAERIRRLPAPGFYDTFPDSMEQAMPAPLRSLLER
jgi:ectoine hydroxylase-related dioxygenase (phytanoyl-CoA dioxygenase family)